MTRNWQEKWPASAKTACYLNMPHTCYRNLAALQQCTSQISTDLNLFITAQQILNSNNSYLWKKDLCVWAPFEKFLKITNWRKIWQLNVIKGQFPSTTLKMLLSWVEQGLTPQQTHYRSYWGRMLLNTTQYSLMSMRYFRFWSAVNLGAIKLGLFFLSGSQHLL